MWWNETKEVELFLALFRDLNTVQVLDLTPGSGAAAMAALILRICYEGIAMNAGHANWLNRILDKAMFAVIADADDEESKKMQADVMTHCSALIDEARGLMYSDMGDPSDDAEESQEETNQEEKLQGA